MSFEDAQEAIEEVLRVHAESLLDPDPPRSPFPTQWLLVVGWGSEDGVHVSFASRRGMPNWMVQGLAWEALHARDRGD